MITLNKKDLGSFVWFYHIVDRTLYIVPCISDHKRVLIATISNNPYKYIKSNKKIDIYQQNIFRGLYDGN